MSLDVSDVLLEIQRRIFFCLCQKTISSLPIPAIIPIVDSIFVMGNNICTCLASRSEFFLGKFAVSNYVAPWGLGSASLHERGTRGDRVAAARDKQCTLSAASFNKNRLNGTNPVLADTKRLDEQSSRSGYANVTEKLCDQQLPIFPCDSLTRVVEKGGKKDGEKGREIGSGVFSNTFDRYKGKLDITRS